MTDNGLIKALAAHALAAAGSRPMPAIAALCDAIGEIAMSCPDPDSSMAASCGLMQSKRRGYIAAVIASREAVPMMSDDVNTAGIPEEVLR